MSALLWAGVVFLVLLLVVGVLADSHRPRR